MDYRSTAFKELFLHEDFVIDVSGDVMNSPSGLKLGAGKQYWDIWLDEGKRFQWVDYDFVILHVNADVVVMKQAYKLLYKKNGKMTDENLGDYLEWQFKDSKIFMIKVYFGHSDAKNKIITEQPADSL